MPQKIPPAAMVIAVIVVIVAIAFIGLRVFGPEPNTNTEEMRKKYMGPTGYRTMTSPTGGSTGTQAAPPGAPPGYQTPGSPK